MSSDPKESSSTDLLNDYEAARLLGVSRTFLQKDRIGGRRVPYIQIGRAVRYDPADLEAFKAANRRGGS